MVELDLMILIVLATFEILGRVEKLSPQDSPSGAYTLLRGSVRTLNTLLRGHFFHTAPRIFNSRFQTVGFLQLYVAS